MYSYANSVVVYYICHHCLFKGSLNPKLDMVIEYSNEIHLSHHKLKTFRLIQSIDMFLLVLIMHPVVKIMVLQVLYYRFHIKLLIPGPGVLEWCAIGGISISLFLCVVQYCRAVFTAQTFQLNLANLT